MDLQSYKLMYGSMRVSKVLFDSINTYDISKKILSYFASLKQFGISEIPETKFSTKLANKG